MEEQLQLQLDRLERAQSPCTDCGLCNAVCITQLANGWEHEGPRGRVRLARAFRDGVIDPSDPVLTSFDRCVNCHACEQVCPEQVEYRTVREAVQEARSLIQQPQRKESWWSRLWGRRSREAVETGEIPPCCQELAHRLGIKARKEQQVVEEAVRLLSRRHDLRIGEPITGWLLGACYPEIDALECVLRKVEGVTLLTDVPYRQVCCGAVADSGQRDQLMSWRREHLEERGTAFVTRERCREAFEGRCAVMHVAELLLRALTEVC